MSILRRAVKEFGVRMQLAKSIEEISELQQAILSKDPQRIMEETVDLELMACQLFHIVHEIKESKEIKELDYAGYKAQKLERLDKILKERGGDL